MPSGKECWPTSLEHYITRVQYINAICKLLWSPYICHRTKLISLYNWQNVSVLFGTAYFTVSLKYILKPMHLLKRKAHCVTLYIKRYNLHASMNLSVMKEAWRIWVIDQLHNKTKQDKTQQSKHCVHIACNIPHAVSLQGTWLGIFWPLAQGTRRRFGEIICWGGARESIYAVE